MVDVHAVIEGQEEKRLSNRVNNAGAVIILMNAKKYMIKDEETGKIIELGKLSKNKLCRGIVGLMEDNTRGYDALHIIIGNIKASVDAST